MRSKGRKGHRLTRSELKEDRFATQVLHAVRFVDRRRKEVGTAAVAVVLIVAAVMFVRTRGRGREAEAAQLLAKAEIALAQDSRQDALAGYRHLMSSFDRTRTGREAGVYLGQLLLEDGDIEGARSAFQMCAERPPSRLLRAAAGSGLAACLEEEGSAEEAAAAYEGLADRYEDTHLGPEMLLRAGRCRQRSGQWPDAAQLFAALVERYPQSTLVPMARFEMAYSRTRAAEGA